MENITSKTVKGAKDEIYRQVYNVSARLVIW